MGSTQLPDLNALLTALVIAPATYSRNRFFEMYAHPAARRVHRRALHLRAMVMQLLQVLSKEADKAGFSSVVKASGDVEISFRVPALGLRRTARLDAMEASLFRVALKRSAQPIPECHEAVQRILGEMGGDIELDWQRIEGALSALSPLAMAENA